MLALLTAVLASVLGALQLRCSGGLPEYTLCWVNYIIQCNVFHHC